MFVKCNEFRIEKNLNPYGVFEPITTHNEVLLCFNLFLLRNIFTSLKLKDFKVLVQIL